MNLSTLRASLDRWRSAGLLDAAAADRILEFESDRGGDRRGSFAQRLAMALGGVLVTAGVLLFVAANWDRIAPGGRFALILLLVFGAHGLAVLPRAAGALSVVLHAVGTGFLGAGIFLAGQLFHLQTHWPAAFLLWALGAAAGWWLLRQWPQAVWLAVLGPIWLGGEYTERVGGFRGYEEPLTAGLLVLALSYLTLAPEDPHLRKALRWLGFAAVIPIGLALAASGSWYAWREPPPTYAFWWLAGLGVPLAVDAALRRRFEWRLVPMAVGAWLMATTGGRPSTPSLWSEFWHQFAIYPISGAMALFLIWWGVGDRRPERVNLGVAAFGVVVIAFYFSTVMDKLGRSISLLGLGALFFLLAFALGKLRRRLLAEIAGPPEEIG